jgi:hypothetical protein
MKRKLNIFKLAAKYLEATKDFGTFLALLFLWKRRKLVPVKAKQERKVSGFIYPH